jgi:hypothetical protein
MVCDGAMVASSLVSMMMNGVCCMYQMQEEDERREAIRKDIRFEYERQRMMDMEYWNYRPNKNSDKRAYHSDSSFPEESYDHDRRRQRLMLAKNKTHSSNADRIDNNRYHDVTTSCPLPMVTTPPRSSDKQLAATGTPPQRRVRSDPVQLSLATERRRARLFRVVDVSGEGGSLMDDDVDERELFDVALG